MGMKFKLINNAVADNACKHIYNAMNDGTGKIYQVEIKEFSEPRTLQQNRYLFGVVYKVIAETLGYTVDEIHGLLAKKFLSEEHIVLSEPVIFVKSTAKMSKKDFAEYLENIFRFAAEFGVVIPDPWATGYMER